MTDQNARESEPTRTMLELIDAYGNAMFSAGTAPPERGAQITETRAAAARAEIVRRLELIDRFGGTEAADIKAILATGDTVKWITEPVRDYESERGLLKSCPACRSRNPKVRLNPGGFACDDPARFHKPTDK